MAPSTQLSPKTELLLRGVNLSRKLGMINSAIQLAEWRDEYMTWFFDVREKVNEFAINQDAKLSFFIEDPVTADWAKNGGVGGDFDTIRAQYIKELVYKCLVENIQKLQAIDMPIGKVRYDSGSKTLFFGEHSVVITERGQSDPADLLRVLFSKPEQNWSTDEVYEEWGCDPVKNKAYQAGIAVNKKVEKETGIDDFLNVTTYEIQINPKHR